MALLVAIQKRMARDHILLANKMPIPRSHDDKLKDFSENDDVAFTESVGQSS